MSFVKTFYGLKGRYLTVITLLRLRSKEDYCIHIFWRGDEDPDCHDHPFEFWSFVLWGGYREYGEDGKFITRTPFSGWAHRPAITRHRVELLRRHCVTLVIKRDAHREWYFYKNGVPIHWRKYLTSKGLVPISNSY